MLGSGVYRRPRVARSAAGHAGPADPPDADLRPAARPRDRPRHQTHLRRRVPRRARRPLPGAPAPGAAALDHRQVGRLLEQPARALLRADSGRPQAAREGNQQVEASGDRDRACARRGGLAVFGRKRPPDDFAEEIEVHLQLEADRLREEGLGVEEARLAARRAYGNVTRSQEQFYESRRWLGWDRLGQELGYAGRMLRKSP